ncbi:MAG: adenylate/guanylate cyclase domain-containing protein, partial [Candidatus Limnocylindrales bacterium]
ALAHADEMLAIGMRLSDRDLEVMGLQDRARVLIAMGRVEEGLQFLDEAVVAAVSGGVSRYSTAVVYCNATVACEDLTDYRRAREFAQVAEQWCATQSISGFPGMCRVRRVELLRLRGAWGEAESEARKACIELADFSLGYAAEGHYQIGEIRLRMGDLDGAEAAFTEAHRLGREPLPGLALARLAQGKIAAAGTLLARALAQPTLIPLERAKLLPAEVEVAVALHDVGRAERAATDLETIAVTFGTEILRALAETARGAVALANSEDEVAVEVLRRAVRSWQSNDAPYETARARLLLGNAYRLAGDEEHAQLEHAAAVSSLEGLGAAGDLARFRAEAEGASAAEPAPGRKPRRERNATRTFMFTDIVGSTALIEAVGDEAWRRLQTWHDETIRSLLREHAGQEIHHAGDGFFVAFERADAAISCAIAIRDTLAEHRKRNGFAPSVRIGLHTAEAVKTATGYEGGGVHAAARVGALAAGGEVLVARSTAEAASKPVLHGPWRTERLRGFREPMELAVLD